MRGKDRQNSHPLVHSPMPAMADAGTEAARNSLHIFHGWQRAFYVSQALLPVGICIIRSLILSWGQHSNPGTPVQNVHNKSTRPTACPPLFPPEHFQESSLQELVHGMAVELFLVMPLSQIREPASSPGCGIADPASCECMLWEAAGDGSGKPVLATHVRALKWVLGSWVQPGSSLALGENLWIKDWSFPSLLYCLCFSSRMKIVNKYSDSQRLLVLAKLKVTKSSQWVCVK